MEQDPQPLRLSIELRPSGAGLRGSLYDEGGTEHEFAGWLGLLTLLEAARLRAQPVPFAA
jgi:hypothetical protein